MPNFAEQRKAAARKQMADLAKCDKEEDALIDPLRQSMKRAAKPNYMGENGSKETPTRTLNSTLTPNTPIGRETYPSYRESLGPAGGRTGVKKPLS